MGQIERVDWRAAMARGAAAAQAAAVEPLAEAAAVPAYLEEHRKPMYWARRWGVAQATVRRWFAEEQGVLMTGGADKGPGGGQGRGKRAHMRVPDSLAARVYAKHLGQNWKA